VKNSVHVAGIQFSVVPVVTKCGTRTSLAPQVDGLPTPPPVIMAAPVQPALWPLSSTEWSMQKIVSEIVNFAEIVHRTVPVASPTRPRELDEQTLTLSDLDGQLTALLARCGIERIDPTGTVFDPCSQQQVGEREVAGRSFGIVVEVLSPTWMLNGQLLRPARVVVSAAWPSQRSAGVVLVGGLDSGAGFVE
jgi:hypothetical protein